MNGLFHIPCLISRPNPRSTPFFLPRPTLKKVFWAPKMEQNSTACRSFSILGYAFQFVHKFLYRFHFSAVDQKQITGPILVVAFWFLDHYTMQIQAIQLQKKRTQKKKNSKERPFLFILFAYQNTMVFDKRISNGNFC